MKKLVCCLFGHRYLFFYDRVAKELEIQLEGLIKNDVCTFLVGYNGEFDKLSRQVLNKLKETYTNIEIIVVVSNINHLKKNKYGYAKVDEFESYKTIIYDIENEHYKRLITKTNQCMVDDSDIVVCYVDMNTTYSGAKLAVKYAKKQNKQIINLYEKINVSL